MGDHFGPADMDMDLEFENMDFELKCLQLNSKTWESDENISISEMDNKPIVDLQGSSDSSTCSPEKMNNNKSIYMKKKNRYRYRRPPNSPEKVKVLDEEIVAKVKKEVAMYNSGSDFDNAMAPIGSGSNLNPDPGENLNKVINHILSQGLRLAAGRIVKLLNWF